MACLNRFISELSSQRNDIWNLLFQGDVNNAWRISPSSPDTIILGWGHLPWNMWVLSRLPSSAQVETRVPWKLLIESLLLNTFDWRSGPTFFLTFLSVTNSASIQYDVMLNSSWNIKDCRVNTNIATIPCSTTRLPLPSSGGLVPSPLNMALWLPLAKII